MALFDGAPDHIRIATPDDRDAVLGFLRELYAENGAQAIAWPKVEKFVDAALTRQNAFVLVIDGKDEIAASMGLIFEQWWYTDEWTLGERWLSVNPRYRRSRYAQDLIETGKMLSDRWSVAFVLGISSTIRTQAKMRLYRRKMAMVGATFVHGLERASGPLALAARGLDVQER